ncbi:MAG TPA: ABC transporter permease [Candidatus Lachnoclostridium stercoravium]|uniref:ABC transporter permease n=1 Tax=Candidatus Lachnoclostridium stercoravium TaxID=2838633 RepID=A0A9D2HJ50_9FIRM|nr:ABC transporter permease [Candidatus Lachnoclostridium stercoravium]
MLIENMTMAFSAIRTNKLRSALTMLGIIIGIGSVISIVSIGDTMRSMFADLYKNIGLTQAYLSIGYWVDDVRQSDYFTLDEMERIKEAFPDEIAYIDSSAMTSADAVYKREKITFDYTGIDYNYQDVQPVNIVYGRYLNEGDILGRKKNAVMDTDSAKMLFGTENAVGKTFRTTLYGSTDDFTVVGVYRKELNAFQALMMGKTSDRGAAFVPYTLLTWPNDYFYQLHIFASEEVNQSVFYDQLKAYAARMRSREPEDMYLYTAMEQMTAVDQVMGGLSAAVGGIAAISLLVGGIGIMNIMLVSVTERTREIGIRKALGARTRDVLIQFLTESAILSACGGIIGVAIGVGVVSIGSALLGMEAVIKPGVILMAVSFSAIVGIFFGIYPASKAAKADPIDALRYE